MLERCVTSGWAVETMQESFAFHILGVGRLREDQLIYVEQRKHVFHSMGPLTKAKGFEIQLLMYVPVFL